MNYVELREFYARSRFVVVPIDPVSDTDNVITATLEAFAMGIPVIISRTIGQVDVIRHGETGLYVPQMFRFAFGIYAVRAWPTCSLQNPTGQSQRVPGHASGSQA